MRVFLFFGPWVQRDKVFIFTFQESRVSSFLLQEMNNCSVRNLKEVPDTGVILVCGAQDRKVPENVIHLVYPM